MWLLIKEQTAKSHQDELHRLEQELITRYSYIGQGHRDAVDIGQVYICVCLIVCIHYTRIIVNIFNKHGRRCRVVKTPKVCTQGREVNVEPKIKQAIFI